MDRIKLFYSESQQAFIRERLLNSTTPDSFCAPTGSSTAFFINDDGFVRLTQFTELTTTALPSFTDAILVGSPIVDELVYVQHENGWVDPTTARLSDRFSKGQLTPEHIREHIAARRQEAEELLAPNHTR